MKAKHPSDASFTLARKYIEDAWGNDGGAVEETADRGYVADVDREALLSLYGRKQGGEVSRALLAVFRPAVGR